MSDPSELSFSAVRDKRARQGSPLSLERATVNTRPVSLPATQPAEPPAAAPAVRTESRTKRRFDRARIATALKDRRQQILVSAVALAIIAFLAGYFLSNYHARVTLVARDASTGFVAGLEGEPYRPRQLTPATLVSLMESPELARRVAAKTKSPKPNDALTGHVRADAVRNTDLVALTVAGKSQQPLVDLANLYANEAVNLTKELQLAEAARMNTFCRAKLAVMDKELQQANTALVKFQSEAKLVDPDAEKQSHIKSLGDVMSRADNLRIDAEMLDVQVAAFQEELAQQNPLAQKLAAAKSKLADLLTRMTEAHPTVQGQRKEIAALESQLAAGQDAPTAAKLSDNSLANALYLRLVELQTRKATMQKELQGLDRLKQSLQEKVTGISQKGTQYALLKARLEGLQKSRALLASRQREAQLYQDHAQGYYRVFTPATLKDIDTSSRWLSGIWAALAGAVIGLVGAGLVVAGAEIADSRLKTVADVEQVTGLSVLATLGDLDAMSSVEREAWAFRTWTALAGQLSASANHGMVCGFVSSTPGEGRSTWIELLARAARRRGLQAVTVTTRQEKNGMARGSDKEAGGGAQTELFTATATSQPLAIQIESPNELSAQIPLPGSVWNLEHRQEWQDALSRCSAMENLVLLVELPPASVPESVLLAESLPQVIWLADSRKARARATREQLATMKHAKCRLVGAVLNHESKPVFNL